MVFSAMNTPLAAMVSIVHACWGEDPILDAACLEMDASIRRYRQTMMRPDLTLAMVAETARAHAAVVAHLATVASAIENASRRKS